MRYCETPRKFHGKPDRKRATTMSSATQSPAQRIIQHERCHQFFVKNSPTADHQVWAATNFFPENSLQQSQTHTAGYNARVALQAHQPTIAPAGNGMNNSQSSEQRQFVSPAQDPTRKQSFL